MEYSAQCSNVLSWVQRNDTTKWLLHTWFYKSVAMWLNVGKHGMFRTRVLNTEGRMSHCVIYRCHTGCDTYVTPGNVTLWHKSAGLAETQMYHKQMTKEGSSCSRQDATSAADLLFSTDMLTRMVTRMLARMLTIWWRGWWRRHHNDEAVDPSALPRPDCRPAQSLLLISHAALSQKSHDHD